MRTSGNESERKKYLNEIKEAGEIVQRILKKNPVFDIQDLYRIVMSKKKQPADKLSTGLRRRTIGNV